MVGRKALGSAVWLTRAAIYGFTYTKGFKLFQDENVECLRDYILRNWFEEHSGQFQHVIW